MSIIQFRPLVWAQTFTVPPFANGLERIEFTMNPFLEADFSGFDTAGDIRFRVLVTNDAEPSFESFRPTEVLFERPTLTSEWVPIPDSGFDEGSTQEFVIDTRGLTVAPGASYAFVLDAFTDYLPDVFGWRSMPSTFDGFESGEFFSLRVDRAADHTPVGSRPNHLSGTWGSFEVEDVDLQFRAYFVPEPSSALVLLIGAMPFAIRRADFALQENSTFRLGKQFAAVGRKHQGLPGSSR